MDLGGRLLGISAWLLLLLPIQAALTTPAAAAGGVRRELLASAQSVGRFQTLGTAPVAGAHIFQFPNTNKYLILDFIIPAGKQPYPKTNPTGRKALQIWDRGTNQYSSIATWNNWVCGGWTPLGDGSVVMFAAHVPWKGFQADLKAIAVVKNNDRSVAGNRQFKLSANRWYATGVRLGTAQTYVLGGTTCAGCWAAREAASQGADLLGINPEQTRPITLPVNDYMVNSGSNNYYVHAFVLPTGKLGIMNNNFVQVLDPFTGLELARTAPLPGEAAGLDWEYPFMGSPAILRTKALETGKDTHVTFIAFGGNYPSRKPTIVSPCANVAASVKLTFTSTGAAYFGPWLVERMPSPRCVANAVVLPNGKVLVLSGAEQGFGGVEKLPFGLPDGGVSPKNRSMCNEPTTTPWVYDPIKTPGTRFSVLNIASRIPRLYHNTALLTSSGDILITGGTYVDDYLSSHKSDFDTTPIGQSEFRVETYSPPEIFQSRPIISSAPSSAGYGQHFTIRFKGAVKTVVIVQQGTNTHGVTMGARVQALRRNPAKGGSVEVQAPPDGNYAPPGYYLLFLVSPSGAYSHGHWFLLDTDRTIPPFAGVWFKPSNSRIHSRRGGATHCLDVSEVKKDGSVLLVRACSKSASQRWTLDSSHRLVNQKSKLCADVVAGKKARKGSPIVQRRCTNSLSQKWIASQSKATGTVSPATTTGLCLEVTTKLLKAGPSWLKLGACNLKADYEKWAVR